MKEVLFPQLEDFVVAKVKKLLPFGAIIELEEYGGLEGFVHISEVSSGWIRNIREHLKEGQVVVAKVIALDIQKRQVDLSVKRVSEVEKKRKLEQWQNEKRALKLLEISVSKAGKTLKQVEADVKLLEEEFGSLYDVFEALAKDITPKSKVSKSLLDVLGETSKREIRVKEFTIRASLSIKSFAPDGVERLKKILSQISASSKRATVHYLGAPNFFVEVTSENAKDAEKTLQKIDSMLSSGVSPDFEYSLEWGK